MACVFVALGRAPAQAQTSRPNVILIMVDDAGYNDFGFSRATTGAASQFQTPRLDALAQQGLVASQGYVASPLCAPSRAGLLTGRYPQRSGLEENAPNNINFPYGLLGNEVMLSHRLKSMGYATGMVGKWHNGFVAGVNRPNDMGFDEFFGFLSGARQYYTETNPANVMYRNSTVVESQWRTEGNSSLYDPVRGRYATDAFGEESAAFINRHANDPNPFFLYTAFTGPHTPLTAKSQDLALFSHITNEQDRTLAAMVYAVDRSVGMMVDALNANGIADNTMIVFLNDNGGPIYANNLPYRDYKGKTHEGGIRVPFFIKAPGLAPGVYNQAINALDVAPTVIAAAGGVIPASETDGVNLLPYLSGGLPSAPHEVMFWRNNTFWAVRKGDWKLARPFEPIPATANYRGLYNLANDPGETTNLIAQQPQIAAELYRELTFWEATLRKPTYGTQGEPRNQFDHFVFNGPVGTTTTFSTAGAWANPLDGSSATLLPDDAYANAILEFPVQQAGSYIASNNMKRMSGEAFMLNEVRLTGTLTAAANRNAAIGGSTMLFVQNLAGQNARMLLDATAAPGAGAFTYNFNAPIQLLSNLEFYGDGTQTFAVNGGIQDYYEPRGIIKSGTSRLTLSGVNTYRGATLVLGGELRIAGASTVVNGSSEVSIGVNAKVSLLAGLLRTPLLTIVPQGQFQFTGGTLQTNMVQGNLANAGGVFAGGADVGTVDILGNFVQTSGTLLLDVGVANGGASVFDRLQATGAVQLGGVLDIDLYNAQGGSFVPTAGTVYEIIAAAGGVTGAFSQTLLPPLPGSLAWELAIGSNNVLLKVVGPAGSIPPPPFTAAGLAVWRQNYGISEGALPSQADWNVDGVVDGGDFLYWQRHAVPAQPAIGSVPEPTAAALLAIAALGVAAHVRRRAYSAAPAKNA